MTEKSKNYNIAAVILAGGNARRLGGIAKGTIEINNGVSIIDKLIKELVKADINNIVISANDSKPYQDYGVQIIPDINVGIGPIAGIESGLKHFADQSDAVMFIPCDMPNITAKEILALKDAFIKTKASAVFAKTADFLWHPLCAVAHGNLKKEISSAIEHGQRKIRGFWQQVNAMAVQFSDETVFLNINNPTDMNRWQGAEN